MTQRKRTKRQVPSFANEDEERRFWATHDVTDYFDWDRAVQTDRSKPGYRPDTSGRDDPRPPRR